MLYFALDQPGRNPGRLLAANNRMRTRPNPALDCPGMVGRSHIDRGRNLFVTRYSVSDTGPRGNARRGWDDRRGVADGAEMAQIAVKKGSRGRITARDAVLDCVLLG